jgi:serine phosphatase RsbU (regulator of sigma subunit)/anti-sigma regulatory factor (Ser/Thr protein kinase)
VVPLRLSVKQVTALLLAWIAVPAYFQASYGSSGLGRWSGYSTLTPVVAGALLPMGVTVLVASVNLAVTAGIFLLIPDVSMQGRLIALIAVVLATGLGVLVCRLRLDREERVTRLMVARDRLSLLGAASAQVGTTLDVARTARELAAVAVPRFADFVSVDLFHAVVAGDDPGPDPPTGPNAPPVVLRRVALASAGGGPLDAMPAPAGPDAYPAVSVPARVLAGGAPDRAATLLDGAQAARWPAGEPGGAPLPGTPPKAHLGRGRPGAHGAHPEGGAHPGRGAHSGISVPLRARGATLGVAVFLRQNSPQPFDQDDLLLAQEIAARAAVCLDNAHRYTRERRRSVTLQRSLMPRALPQSSAVDTAGGYLPSGTRAGVGGDWFDVIPLSGARVALVIGDVVGHGLHASATMGLLRAAVRTLADIDLPPDELLTHLDDVVTRMGSESDADGGMPAGAADNISAGPLPAGASGYAPAVLPGGGSGGEVGATCLYAVYDPVSGSCVLARAGHPPPALVLPDGTVEFVDAPAGPPLGFGGLPFESMELKLPPGSVLALFTDGLVESRRQEAEDGFDRLRRALAGAAGRTLAGARDTVLRTMLDDQQRDDVALLLARTRVLDGGHVATWDLPADPASVGRARDLADAQLAAWGLDDAVFTMELVVSELVTNAVRYGETPVQLRLIREEALICEVSDGSSTAPHLRRARTMDEGGRGLFIVAQLTERWGTRHGPGGKTIWSELSLPRSA